MSQGPQKHYPYRLIDISYRNECNNILQLLLLRSIGFSPVSKGIYGRSSNTRTIKRALYTQNMPRELRITSLTTSITFIYRWNILRDFITSHHTPTTSISTSHWCHVEQCGFRNPLRWYRILQYVCTACTSAHVFIKVHTACDLLPAM